MLLPSPFLEVFFHTICLLQAQRDELKVDLGKAKKGKPLGNDKDGKPKKNSPPEQWDLKHFLLYFVYLYKWRQQVDNITKSTCRIEKKIAAIETKIEKMEMDKKIKEDLKTVALGTSKINYLDPRITVAWCKRHEVPIEKVQSWDNIFSSLISLLIMYTVTEPVLNIDFADRFSTNHFLRNSDGQWMLIRNSDSSRALLVAMFDPASSPSSGH